MNTISFMTANYVAREVGYAMHGWGHGDRATNDAFRPLETYAERLDEVLADIRALGFDAVDLWGGHLNPAWATDEHVAVACELLARHGLRVATLEVFVEPDEVGRACDGEMPSRRLATHCETRAAIPVRCDSSSRHSSIRMRSARLSGS